MAIEPWTFEFGAAWVSRTPAPLPFIYFRIHAVRTCSYRGNIALHFANPIFEWAPPEWLRIIVCFASMLLCCLHGPSDVNNFYNYKCHCILNLFLARDLCSGSAPGTYEFQVHFLNRWANRACKLWGAFVAFTLLPKMRALTTGRDRHCNLWFQPRPYPWDHTNRK